MAQEDDRHARVPLANRPRQQRHVGGKPGEACRTEVAQLPRPGGVAVAAMVVRVDGQPGPNTGGGERGVAPGMLAAAMGNLDDPAQ